MKFKGFDSNPSAAMGFLVQQGAHIEAQVYSQEYPQFKSRQLLDIVSEGGEWNKFVVFRSMDAAGKMEWMGDSSTDIATADVAFKQGQHEIKTAALGYRYSLPELNYAAQLGENLDAEKAIAVRDIVEQGLNELYLLGDASVGYQGLYNSSLVPKTSAAGTIAAAIAAKDPLKVIQIFAAAYNGVYSTQTNTVHRPTHFVIPTDQYLALNQNFVDFGNASNISYMAVLKMSFPDMTFEDDIFAKGTGAASADRLICYKKDVRCVKGHEPMRLKFMAPATSDNINFVVPAMVRSGGTEIRIPKSMHYVDGI
jgi:hypothetical protein